MATYAILGATGKVGLATSSTLRQAGMSVRAILHDASKAAPLRSIGCEIAVADLHNIESLAKAFIRTDVVQVILPLDPKAKNPLADMNEVMECLIGALMITKPKRILLISDYGAHVSSDIGIPSIFYSFEKRLSQLPGQQIFLRSAEQMENWARVLPAAIRSGTLSTFYDSMDKAHPAICARDVGTISANLLMSPLDGPVTQVVHAEGPHRYSAKDLAETFSELLGRTMAAELIPRAQWKNILEQEMSPTLSNLLIKTSDAHNKGGLIDVQPGSSEIRRGTTELREALEALLRSYI